MKLRLIMTILAFIAGITASNMLAGASDFNTPVHTGGFEMPAKINTPINEMPQDRISENQIRVYQDRVILDIQDAQWSKFTPTKSMVPFLDAGANAIQVKPKDNCADVEAGDIISYKSNYADGIIIHRVIEKGTDSKGIYFKAKGDNNPREDPGKIRCDQIQRVLVAIIY